MKNVKQFKQENLIYVQNNTKKPDIIYSNKCQFTGFCHWTDTERK